MSSYLKNLQAGAEALRLAATRNERAASAARAEAADSCNTGDTQMESNSSHCSRQYGQWPLPCSG